MHDQPAQDPMPAFAALLAAGGRHVPQQKVAVVVAHPDDETIGIGGHLHCLPGVRIIHVTDGAPRDMADANAHGFSTWQDYAAARREELLASVAEAGLSADALAGLDVPDKEAVRHLPVLARQLAERLEGIDFVCTHPFEGGHPDHDATAFSVHAACELLRRDGTQAPAIVEMAFYHAGPDGPVFQHFAGSDPCLEVCLVDQAFEQKRRMIARHVTQQRVLAAFGSRLERFRAAPRYAFAGLPNDGRLYYEALPFGWTGAEWLQQARSACDELGLGRP